MGDWEDLCELLGLTAAAQWEEVEQRLFCCERPRSVRSTLPSSTLSEQDRPQDLPSKVAEAFQAAGFEYPREAEMLQYAYRFTLPTGGRFDLYYERSGRPTSFALLSMSEHEGLQVRESLQHHLARPCPAEKGVWNRSREQEMYAAFQQAGLCGLWVDHKPFKTQIVLRKTSYPQRATSPALERTKRWGMVILQHSPPNESRVQGKWGDADMLQRLVDGLIVFGLVSVPKEDA